MDRDSCATVGGNDCVCFTAGHQGAAFGAGAIHAHLVADREPPEVVAGISFGAVNAAAMQRAYQELARAGETERESRRWHWFRKYLDAITRDPTRPLRDALPGLVDVLSDRPPLMNPAYEGLEWRVIVKRYRKARLIQWLARTRVSVSDLSRLVSSRVRHIESRKRVTKSLWTLAAVAIKVEILLVWQLALHPCFANTVHFAKSRRRNVAPLFGWPAFLLAWLTVILWACGAVWLGFLLWTGESAWVLLLAFLLGLAGPLLFAGWVWSGRRRKLFVRILKSVGSDQGLASRFYVGKALHELFGGGPVTTKSPEGPRLLIVVASLQATKELVDVEDPQQGFGNKQHWLEDLPIDRALLTAISSPPLFTPTRESTKRTRPSGQVPEASQDLQFADGSIVRQNPLPALFRFLKSQPEVAYRLCTESRDGEVQARRSPAIRVIYSVPISASQRATLESRRANIVDVVGIGRKLALRRDTQLEVEHANMITNLERQVWSATGTPSEDAVDVHPLLTEEVAPDEDTIDERPFLADEDRSTGGQARPVNGREAALAQVAAGCRRNLEVMYSTELAQLESEGSLVRCIELVRLVAARRASELASRDRAPGLPEVCAACSGCLRRKPAPQGPSRVVTSGLDHEKFPTLANPDPKIVIAASGGVFRGSFHIGMAGALHSAGVKPDIIVGASVGSLIGASMASLYSEGCNTRERLELLTKAFVEVDRRVALTDTFLSLVRDVSTRSGLVTLTPAEIRKMMIRGSRADPGFAATGAPPILIDAIADLFLIPRKETSKIAAAAIAGQGSEAFDLLLSAIKTYVLRRFQIEECVMGTSLLESLARRLIEFDGIDLSERQPFLRGAHPIAFFATTTDLGAECSTLLGDDSLFPGQPFDFIEAVLASSAFPGVFAPRRQSNVFPGRGLTNVRYSDGGMFDNLPISSALAVLAQTRTDYRVAQGMSPWESLQARHECPDLLLIGALNASPPIAIRDSFDDVLAVHERASILSHSVKIRSFEYYTDKVYKQVTRLLGSDNPEGVEDPEFLDRVPVSSILPIFPSTSEHLNGTFAFSRTLGLKPERIRKSIADGCYQTLGALSWSYEASRESGEHNLQHQLASIVPPTDRTMATLDALRKRGRVPDIRPYFPARIADAAECPFYFIVADGSQQPHRCPFHDADKAVFDACTTDASHGSNLEYPKPSDMETADSQS